MRRSIRTIRVCLLLAANVFPVAAYSQGIIVNTYPREVTTTRQVSRTSPEVTSRLNAAIRDTVVRRRGERPIPQTVDSITAVDSLRLAPEEISRIRTAVVESEAKILRRWTYLNNDDAAKLWPKLALLPAASVSPGTDRTALYTELGQALSGGWRFVLGTALAVATGEGNDEDTPETAQADAEAPDTESGFRRFLAGGGNLSFSAMRPFSMLGGTYTTHVIYFAPRVWSNIPTLSDADAVEDFGGEIAGEYQYQRYARQMSTDAMPELPFLVFQFRTGLVKGTNSFYRTIGRDKSAFFAYTVPTLSLNFSNGVRIGASYFYAFGVFKEHESLRFQINLSPSKKEENTR